MTIIYGIKNCDTMKKAMKWLNNNNVDYVFHDYKKDEFPTDVIKHAIETHGWNIVINQRGTTWRQLDDDIKDSMDNDLALKIASENASIIKRPLLIHKNKSYAGFKQPEYEAIFKS